MKLMSLEKTLAVMQWHVEQRKCVDPSEIKYWIESIEQTPNTGYRSGQSMSDKDLVRCLDRCGRYECKNLSDCIVI